MLFVTGTKYILEKFERRRGGPHASINCSGLQAASAAAYLGTYLEEVTPGLSQPHKVESSRQRLFPRSRRLTIVGEKKKKVDRG